MIRTRALLTALALVNLLACRPELAPPRPPPVPRTPTSFRAARPLLARIHADHRTTFYCGCAFDEHGTLDSSACGYRPRHDNHAAHRIEWEHLVPAAAFGKHRPCWRGETCAAPRRGRKCCQTSDPQFKRMEADLANLVPAVGELNRARSDFVFADIPGEPRWFGACDFEVDPARHVAEVAADRRGDVARAYLYMWRHYPGALPLSDAELRQHRAWHAADPPTDWERERARRIATIQGCDPLALP